MRPIEKWNEAYLEQLIRSKVEESVHLDYKRTAALKPGDTDELTKDVSSFANSAGGFLVYGVAEDSNRRFPERIDGGIDPKLVSKEWMEQILDSRIDPRIPDYRIKAIHLRKSSPGKVVYVIWVPQSRLAPHMAADHKYYKRGNFKAQPMENYEVRDILTRAYTPELVLIPYFDGARSGRDAIIRTLIGNNYTNLTIFITNRVSQPAEFAKVIVYLDRRIIKGVSHKHSSRVKSSVKKLEIEGNEFEFEAHERLWGLSGDLPIWKDVELQLFPDPISVGLHLDGEKRYLAYSIESPGMAKTTRGWELAVTDNCNLVVRDVEVRS